MMRGWDQSMQKVPQGHTPRTTMSADTFNTLSSGSIGHGVYAGQMLLQNACLVHTSRLPVCPSACSNYKRTMLALS